MLGQISVQFLKDKKLFKHFLVLTLVWPIQIVGPIIFTNLTLVAEILGKHNFNGVKRYLNKN